MIHLAELAELSGIPAAALRWPDREPYDYVYDFGSVASGGSASGTPTIIDRGSVFVHVLTVGEIRLDALLGSSVAGTPLPRRSDPNSAVNQLPTWAHWRVMMGDQSGDWASSPVRWSTAVGDAIEPAYLMFPRVIPPGRQLRFTAFNDGAVAATAQIVLRGLRIPTSAA